MKMKPGVWMLGLLTVLSAVAKPRPAHPPFPEGQIGQWRFNLTNRVDDDVLDAQGYTLVESWSGYALQMSGSAPRRWLISTVHENARPSVTSGSGTIRWWLCPYWASKSTGGSGPGTWARLLDIGRADGTGFWLSLVADREGNRLKLITPIAGIPTTLVDTPIQWSSNQWHQLALVYGTNGLKLVADGNVVGSSAVLPLWPSTADWPNYLLSLGGNFQGHELAQGELDELTTFAGPVNIEYLAWQCGLTAPIAALGPMSDQVGRGVPAEALDGGAMTMSGPPPPDGGGGGGGSNPPPWLVTGPGLKLTAPVIVGSALSTSLKEADTNSAYEIFHRLSLNSTSQWFRAAAGDLGQTNFSVTKPSTNAAFYQAAEIFDTDFDGLSDAYERWVSGTSGTSPDTDGDGIPDGKDDANGNGVPDYVDYAGLNRAIIWASRPSAFEGALSGELTIRLPTPAPTNNTLVMLHLSKNVDYDGDYYLTRLDNGARVTNDLFFAAGETQQKLLVHAVNDTDQAPRPRTLQAKLESSTNYQLDWEMAEVALIDNDLPTVYIFAPDPEAGETNGNPGQFKITREGVLTNTLTVQLAISGTASNTVDYTNIATSITIPTNSNFAVIPVFGTNDTIYEGNETVILTIRTNAAYQIHPNGGSATVTILEDDLPVVSLVGSDLVASEYAPMTATVTFRRTGNTSQALIVPFAVGGTATNANDYQALPTTVTIPAGSTDGTLTITPIADGIVEQVDTITITLKGSHAYSIGASNSVTVLLDDNSTTVYNIVQRKTTSVYNPGSIDSPAVIEMHRWGRASVAANIPFVIQTNASGGPVPTTHYRKYGDTGGPLNAPYAVFNAYQSVARMYFTAPNAVPISSQIGGVDFMWSNSVWPIFFLANNRYLKFEIVTTNAVEGGAQGRVRLSRLATGEGWTVPIPMGGTPKPAEFIGPDHNLPSTFSLTLAANALNAESAVIANNDGMFEGWETLIFKPNPMDQQVSIDPKDFMMFLVDNVPDLNTLADSDTDNDGLPDRWELNNGFDPFTDGDDSLDPDKDGLTNLEEYQNKLNPRDDDTDGDNEKDYAEANKEVDLSEFVEIRLRTQDTGKVNNGANCAVCHTTQLRVGDFSHYAVRTNATEKSFFLRKGTNYPIWLSELVQNLPRPNQETANPSTTARYTAAIVPPTNGPAAYIFTDPQNRLGTNKVWTNSFPVNPTLPIGTVTVARIEVLWTNVPGNVPLETNSNTGDGLRVFPDRQHWTDGTARNILRVRVRTVPPLPAEQRILLKSFDVDDPMYPIDANDIFVDTNDVSGAKGDDNRGTPLTGQLAATVVTLNTSGEAITNFTVTMQPGNNFRVAAVLDTTNAQAHLDKLQVTNANAPFYVSPDSSHARGFVGGVSPMLTVWRKLHLEFDSMTAAPPTGDEINYFPGKLVLISGVPGPGRSLVRIRFNTPEETPHVFQRGKLVVPGVGVYKVLNSTRVYAPDIAPPDSDVVVLDVQDIPTNISRGSDVTLYDDDDQYLANDPTYPSLLGLQSPPLPYWQQSSNIVAAMQPRFDPAYIVLVNANALGWNTQPTIPFKRNAPSGHRFFDSLTSDFDDALQLQGRDAPAFWAYSVVFGYQPELGKDGEANDEHPLAGETQKRLAGLSTYGFSVVWMESIRERQFAVGRDGLSAITEAVFTSPGQTNVLRSRYLNDLYGNVAHEIGHSPGGQWEGTDHGEDGLMQEGAAAIDFTSFFPVTIMRFRSALRWTE